MYPVYCLENCECCALTASRGADAAILGAKLSCLRHRKERRAKIGARYRQVIEMVAQFSFST